MTVKNIAIISAAGVAAVALIGTGTAVALKRRNRTAQESIAPELVEETVAAGAEAFLAEQETAVPAS